MISNRMLIAATAIALVAAVLPLPALLSALLILAFLAVVPGAVCCAVLDFEVTGAFGWTIVLAASFGIDALINEALLYSHVWTPTTALLTTAALVLVGIAVQGRINRSTKVEALGGPPVR